MQKVIDAIKNNKRITFAVLAVLVVIANQFGFVDYQLDENVVIVAMAVVNLVLSVLRKYWDI